MAAWKSSHNSLAAIPHCAKALALQLGATQGIDRVLRDRRSEFDHRERFRSANRNAPCCQHAGYPGIHSVTIATRRTLVGTQFDQS